MIEPVQFTETICASGSEKSGAFQDELLHTVVDTDQSSGPIFYRVDIDVFCVYQLYFESKEHDFRSKNATMCASGCEKSAIFQKELCHTVVLIDQSSGPNFFPDAFLRES